MTHRNQSNAPMLTQQRLRELFTYSLDDGLFRRRVAVSNTKIGDVAGGLDRKGYIIIRVDSVMYRAHRLAFLYMIGRMPVLEVDHINGAKSDNRWANLREATSYANAQNHSKPRRDNKTGVRGVHWRAANQKFVAQISVDGRRVCLGYFERVEVAAMAYEEARDRHHPGFIRKRETAS